MSIQTELDRIIAAVDAAHTKVAEKGGTTARPYLVGNLESAIASIPASADPKLQTKTVTPTTAQQNVTPDSGYDGLSKVTVNAMPTAAQATPSISVDANGKITASATQSAGYVAAGTKSATKQLTTQAAKTVTPGTSNQTAVASGRYTTGAITVKGDANLKAENIKRGVSIFGVSGSYEGSGGGGGSMETCEVTIVQTWGMGDDPELLRLYVPYYNVSASGSVTSGYTELTSAGDYEPQHSITFTAAKNMPITVYVYGFSGNKQWTTGKTGGTVSELGKVGGGGYLYRLTPTSATATFTFTIP